MAVKYRRDMKKETRICFIGDSFVNGTCDEQALGWVGRLCALAMQQGIDLTYYNLGIRGNTSQNVLDRIEAEVSLRFGKAEDERVVLSFGVNDTLIDDVSSQNLSNIAPRVSEGKSIENMEKIIRLIQPKYSILIVGLLPVDGDEQNTRIESVNAAFKKKAKQLDVPFIDIYYELVNDSIYRKEIHNADGAHPTNHGYRKISELILASGKWWF